MKANEKFIKPAQFAEKEIIKAIVEDKWKAGHKLLPERDLAIFLGITRPTLREVLQRLARDGWITIKHGRPTIVNDYKNNGGLGVLKTLTNYNEFTSKTLILNWLEFRILIIPQLAQKAIDYNASEILNFLKQIPTIETKASDFSTFDWNLQMLLIRQSENIIALMLYNDLSEIYHQNGQFYFEKEITKSKSINYYKNLQYAIKNDKTSVQTIVKHAMQESLSLFRA